METVYVTAGQSVAEGDPILKLTEESVASYKKDLEEAVTEAKTAVSEAGLSAEKQKVSASYSYNLSTAEGSVAQETYEAKSQPPSGDRWIPAISSKITGTGALAHG